MAIEQGNKRNITRGRLYSNIVYTYMYYITVYFRATPPPSVPLDLTPFAGCSVHFAICSTENLFMIRSSMKNGQKISNVCGIS